MSFGVNKNCRVCLGGVEPVLELVPTPIANAFTPTPEPFAPRFPLGLSQCKGCGHVQIGFEIATSELFRDYKYATPPAETPRLEAQARKLAARYPQALSPRANSHNKASVKPQVLEIGSNNGRFLQALNAAGFWAIGVDPAGPSSGLPRWFTHKSATAMRGSMGRMKLILANNVFAHVEDLRNVVAGVAELLDEDGRLIFEVQYLPTLVRGCFFDMIYHEHRDYHTLSPLPKLFKKFGLRVEFVELIPTHGGSIRVTVERGEPNGNTIPADPVINWADFSARIEREAFRIARAIGQAPHPIVAFGATAKATTLIHHCGLQEEIAYCVDDTPGKQGLYIPGTAIEISPSERMERERPGSILLTAWNFADVLRSRLSEYPLIVPHQLGLAEERAA